MAASDWPDGFFDRQDRGDDADFYAPPRLVTHIDDGAVAAVSELYDELGVPDGRVLDLMSSWVSHLSRKPSGGLVVLGMNVVELQANPVADEVVFQDLNVDPRLPFDDASFDAVVCCVSIDYLTCPVEVLREAARVLRPGGVVVLSFSNRCFPTKAVHGWLATDEDGRLAIARAYLEQAGFKAVSTACGPSGVWAAIRCTARGPGVSEAVCRAFTRESQLDDLDRARLPSRHGGIQPR